MSRPVDPPDLFERAIAAAANADVAVVVVGTNDEWESEGEDRESIQLPGEQDELVACVAAANPNTVVVVNAGSPVSMPWADDVAAIVVAFFGGQETGPGVAAVLVGDADPGGRLPITYPRALEDTPAWPHYRPVGGIQAYGEGLLVGYRGFDAAGLRPRYPFGHGLSYGTSSWSDATLASPTITLGEAAAVRLTVTSTGERPVTDVVQIYLAALDPPVARPPKELVAWRKVVVEPGESVEVDIALAPSRVPPLGRRWGTVGRRPRRL